MSRIYRISYHIISVTCARLPAFFLKYVDHFPACCSFIWQEVALIVRDFSDSRLLLGALGLLGDWSVTCAATVITLGCGVHVVSLDKSSDLLQQECIFSPVVSHSSHMATTHSKWYPLKKNPTTTTTTTRAKPEG